MNKNMSFITEGKTNLKYILIVVILSAIVGGGILWLAMKIEQKFLFPIPEIKKLEDGTAPIGVPCGGWDTFGEVVCECVGDFNKDICPQDAICDGEIYKCYGICGECKCYQGSAENRREIPCNNRDKFFK